MSHLEDLCLRTHSLFNLLGLNQDIRRVGNTIRAAHSRLSTLALKNARDEIEMCTWNEMTKSFGSI